MNATDNSVPEPDRRESAERRLLLDRRSGVDRRELRAPEAAEGERRIAENRRAGGERRAYLERRLSLQSAGDQIRGALKLITTAIESGSVAEKQRRNLEAAMLRLRFALERIESE